MPGQGSPLRIGVWCAVSSQAQAAEDKISLEEQERSGREFAEAVDGQVVAVYRIPGHTRDLIFWQEAEEQMPAYRYLREDVQAGRLDVLWNADLDRLGRDPALINQVISLVEKGGAEVYSASTPHPLGAKSVGFRYISAIQAVRAGEDQVQRIARHRMGMKGRIVKRGLMASHPPLGYAPVRDTLGGEVTGYEFSEDMGAVELITDLFLQGVSYEQIARQMEDSAWTPPGGKRWHGTTVRRLMQNDVYAGLPSWSDYSAEEPSPAFPALWSPARFAEVVRERQRRDVGGYIRRGGGPFTGVAYCRRCGGRMIRMHRYYTTTAGERRAYQYLICGLRGRTQGQESCHPNHLPEKRVATAISEFLDWLSTEDRLDQALEEWGQGPEEQALTGDLARARESEERLAAQRRRLGLALAAGKMDFDLYRDLDDDLLRKLEAEQGRVTLLEQQIAALPDMEQRRAVLEQLAALFPQMVRQEEPEALASFLQNAGLVVWCEGGEVIEVCLG